MTEIPAPRDDDNEHERSELVMPFVLCESNGGELDDEAFTLGYLCGSVSAELANLPDAVVEYERLVQVRAIPQLDLIAMYRGWVVYVDEVSDAEGFRLLRLHRRVDEAVPPDD